MICFDLWILKENDLYPWWEKVLCYFLKVAFVVAFAMTSSKFRTMTFWKTFLHNVNKPILKSLCKFQVDIPINARLDNLYAFAEANKQWFSVLIAVFEHGKVVSSTRKNVRARDVVESPEGVSP